MDELSQIWDIVSKYDNLSSLFLNVGSIISVLIHIIIHILNRKKEQSNYKTKVMQYKDQKILEKNTHIRIYEQLIKSKNEQISNLEETIKKLKTDSKVTGFKIEDFANGVK